MECFDVFLESMKDIDLISEAAEIGQMSKIAGERVKGNALARSGYVLLCGYFEGFLRDLISEYVDGINDAKVQVGQMPDHLLHSAISDVLCQEPPEKSVTRVKTSILANTHLAVNAKKHSKTGGNPTVDNVEALFSALGFPSVIDTLSIQDFQVTSTFVSESQVSALMKASIESTLQATHISDPETVIAELVELIDAQWSPKKKRRKIGYVSAIEELLKRRNRIAHGEGREPIAVQDLKDSAKFVNQLCMGLHSILLKQLTSLAPA